MTDHKTMYIGIAREVTQGTPVVPSFFPKWLDGSTREGVIRLTPNENKDELPADLLTVQEVAKQLRIDQTTCRRWIHEGLLPAITLPHRGTRKSYRIRRSTLNALLNPTTERPHS